MEFENKAFTPKGQGNFNTVGGALGIASFLGLGANGGGCGNGGILNFNNNDCNVSYREAQCMTALAIAQSEKESTKQSKNDMERLFQEFRTTDAKIADGLIQTGNALGVLTADVRCLQEGVARNREESFRNLQEAKGYTDTSVMAEAQLRKCGDEKVELWVRAQNYIPAVMKIDADQICGASPVGGCGC